ncbi:hypothetical protein G6F56_008847 [Rhizopus delemar]|uniref:Uncharacterized protein n=1 Tax=Rhizopus stolonifer TaxID=4846 RepID=A0A367KA91_RHIST|nr:hypothetical protein G6F56_008847 [Rhizopus delemar]RCH99049.1 hypothetical protein CU098_010872 [Rhizopus stolonifer]
MRFSLAIASSLLLAQLALAAPAAKTNMAIDLKEFKNAQISPLAFQDSFETFNWKKEGEENTVVDRVFSFDLAEPAQLQVTDFLQGGDVYEIMDNGEVVTLTSDSTAANDLYAATPEQALENEGFSKANIPLAAGKHEITINVAGAVSDSGSGAVRLVQNVQALFKEKDDDDREHDDKDDKDDSDSDYDDDSDSEDEWEHDDDKDGEWEHDDDKDGEWEHDDDEDEWSHDDKEWKHGGKKHGGKKHGGKKNGGKEEVKEPEITKYYYVYYTETQTETISIHAHNHEHENDRAHHRILINEPRPASASMVVPMAPKAKASMLSLPFLPIH